MANLSIFIGACVSFLLLKLTSSLHVSRHKDFHCINDKRLTNGCNFAFDDFRKKFTPACNMHDICYYCGVTTGITRGDCDEIFYEHMMQTCEGNFGCELHAFLYFSGTSIFGSTFYFGEKLQICERPCIQRMLRSIKNVVDKKRR